ncbi:PIN domain-containing protein [Hyaloraphidium curvatum]|nr:PIN domain-containing protein [Hyaloraphidium curvatum]
MDDFMDLDDAEVTVVADQLSAFRSVASPAAFNASHSLSSPPQPSEVRGVPLVVDTNFLLSHLRTFARLVAAAGTLYAVCLPWTVLSELDAISKGPRASEQRGERGSHRTELSRLAADANRLLLSLFSQRTPHLVGQSLAEHASLPLPPGATNDDHILTYCLWLASHAGRVLLLTADRNLSVKAVVNGITVVDNDRFRIGAPENVVAGALFQNSSPTSASPPQLRSSAPMGVHEPHVGWASANHQHSYGGDDDDDMAIDDPPQHHPPPRPERATFPVPASPSKPPAPASPALQVHALLPALLTPAFLHHFHRLLSADPSIVSPPKSGSWTTTELLSLVNRHWISVFSEVYPRSLRDQLPALQQACKTLDRMAEYGLGTLTAEEERTFLKAAEVLIGIAGVDAAGALDCRRAIREGSGGIRTG